MYWKQLAAIDAADLIAYRHVLSLLFIGGVMTIGSGARELRAALHSRDALVYHGFSGALLTLNWLVFVWGVNHGRVLETSLGYFLVPLVNVALGRLVLHERLRTIQWAAIGFAVVGVIVLLIRVGHPPWIALALAATFGVYGLLRKKSPVGPLIGLGLETLLLAPFAVGFLVWRHATGHNALSHADPQTQVLLLCAGVITAVPLLLFAYGARRIRFSTLGLLQYIAPTVQFMIGAWVYQEPFSRTQAAAFALIWCGLVLYTADNLWNQPRAVRD